MGAGIHAAPAHRYPILEMGDFPAFAVDPGHLIPEELAGVPSEGKAPP